MRAGIEQPLALNEVFIGARAFRSPTGAAISSPYPHQRRHRRLGKIPPHYQRVQKTIICHHTPSTRRNIRTVLIRTILIRTFLQAISITPESSTQTSHREQESLQLTYK